MAALATTTRSLQRRANAGPVKDKGWRCPKDEIEDQNLVY